MLYLSFPVAMFWVSNQAEYFEEYIVKRKVRDATDIFHHPSALYVNFNNKRFPSLYFFFLNVLLISMVYHIAGDLSPWWRFKSKCKTLWKFITFQRTFRLSLVPHVTYNNLLHWLSEERVGGLQRTSARSEREADTKRHIYGKWKLTVWTKGFNISPIDVFYYFRAGEKEITALKWQLCLLLITSEDQHILKGLLDVILNYKGIQKWVS